MFPASSGVKEWLPSPEWKQKVCLFTWRASSPTPPQEASINAAEQSPPRPSKSPRSRRPRESRSPRDGARGLGNDDKALGRERGTSRAARGAFMFSHFATKRELKWAASVKRTPLSPADAEWRRRRRRPRQQKMRLEPEQQTLASRSLLPGKAFLLTRACRGGPSASIRTERVFGSERAARGGGPPGGGVGEGAGVLFGREGVCCGVCQFADGNRASRSGWAMHRLALVAKACVTNLPERGGLKRRLS